MTHIKCKSLWSTLDSISQPKFQALWLVMVLLERQVLLHIDYGVEAFIGGADMSSHFLYHKCLPGEFLCALILEYF